MALFAIGDLHLSFGVDKPMDRFGSQWKNHPKKIAKNWKKRIKSTDTVVLTGDHTWGRNIDEARLDFDFIESLPGRKILLRGNHDMFWDAKKTDKLNELFDGRLLFLQNNFYAYEDYALVGTKGYCYEGKDTPQHCAKIIAREVVRLQSSFDSAKRAGYTKFIMFLHYPPTSIGEMESTFTRLAEIYKAEQVVYSHCHGEERFYDSFHGMVNGVYYSLVSCDFLRFCPLKILS